MKEALAKIDQHSSEASEGMPSFKEEVAARLLRKKLERQEQKLRRQDEASTPTV